MSYYKLAHLSHAMKNQRHYHHRNCFSTFCTIFLVRGFPVGAGHHDERDRGGPAVQGRVSRLPLPRHSGKNRII